MHPRRRRRFLAPALAFGLAVQLSLGALAVGPATIARPAQPEAASAARPVVVAGPREQGAGHQADRLTIVRGGVPRRLATPASALARPVVRTAPTPAAAVPNVAESSAQPPVAPKPARTATPAKAPAAKAPASYAGKNHVWIPALGINRSVSFYACSRRTALANVVYRWGCAGKNNVYLMGHAHSVFRSLHNAYVNGRLRKGMQVIYADANGRITRYRISFWKVVSPVGQSWAYAAQSTPSMTLQTCVGSRSQYRLVVRLVKSG